MEALAQRMTSVEQVLDSCVNDITEVKIQIQEYKSRFDEQITNLNMRIVALEDKVLSLQSLPVKVAKQRELTEERTNRQLRETLVFKNVKEELPNESYAQTKEVLAKLVSDTCDIPYEDVFSEIKRAHLESIKMKKRS